MSDKKTFAYPTARSASEHQKHCGPSVQPTAEPACPSRCGGSLHCNLRDSEYLESLYSAVVIDHLWQSIQTAWNTGTAFVITWDNLGKELFRLTIQYLFTWLFYYLQSYLMANVARPWCSPCEPRSPASFTACRALL